MELKKAKNGPYYFLTLSLILTTLVPSFPSERRSSLRIDLISSLPRNDIFSYYFSFLQWEIYKTNKLASAQPAVNCTNNQTAKRVGHVSHYRKQDNLQAWKQLKSSMKIDSTFIYDDNGYIVGLRLLSDSERASFRQSTVAAIRGDQDQCCSTIESFYANRTLQDVRGVMQALQQTSTSPQYIRHGSCGVRGFCRGRCVLTNINLCLFTSSDPYRCKFFSIPGYCTCKNFG